MKQTDKIQPVLFKITLLEQPTAPPPKKKKLGKKTPLGLKGVRFGEAVDNSSQTQSRGQ